MSQAALAEQNSEDPRTACRFELYFDGIELCNGYQELTDTEILRLRQRQQNECRAWHGSETLPGAELMEQAMLAGLPRCSGVALGFDRLMMVLTGATNIASVMPFPIDRA